MMKRVICIWIPRWPLERLYAARPELRHVPLALYERQARGGLRIVAASPLAEQRQVTPGMTVAEATSMAAGSRRGGRTAALRLLPCDPAADRAALVQLAAACEMFSPIVGLEDGGLEDGGLEDGAWPESLLLDVTGLDRLFGGEAALLKQVAESFRRQQLPARVALADTIGAAWAVAHYAWAEEQDSSAADSWLVPPGETSAALAALPIESLRLPDPLLAWLRELGLLTLAQLEPLERAGVAARFGPRLLLRWDQALGRVPEVIRPCRIDTPERAEHLLESPTGSREAIARVLAEQLAKLAAALHQRRQGMARLACRLQSESGQAICFTIALVRPTLSQRHLLDLLQLKLERLTLSDAVAGIGLEVLASAPLACHQQELFETGTAADDEQALGQWVDRLSSRLGAAAVVQARAWPDAQPEHAWRPAPLLSQARRQPRPASGRRAPRALASRWPVLRAGQRPLRLEREPVPVKLVSIVPDGPPISLWLDGQEERIVERWGPERIETGWWRGRSARRDYYRVETQSGRRLWLFRRLTDNRWFLHGWFD
jgi:protein ImuB